MCPEEHMSGPSNPSFAASCSQIPQKWVGTRPGGNSEAGAGELHWSSQAIWSSPDCTEPLGDCIKSGKTRSEIYINPRQSGKTRSEIYIEQDQETQSHKIHTNQQLKIKTCPKKHMEKPMKKPWKFEILPPPWPRASSSWSAPWWPPETPPKWLRICGGEERQLGTGWDGLVVVYSGLFFWEMNRF